MQIKDFKDKHKGVRAFLVGTGPSLKYTDMEKLIGEVNFSLNNISDYWTELYPNTRWRPKYYYNSTKSAIKYDGWRRKANLAVDNCEAAFLSVQSPVKDAENVMRFEFRAIGCKECGEPIPRFSIKPNQVVLHYRMSMWGMAQMAVYMGCNPIYFVGCDIGWKAADEVSDDHNHFKDTYAGDFTWSPYFARRENFYHHEAHRYLSGMFEKVGVEAYNATIGGELEEYPRVEFDSLFD